MDQKEKELLEKTFDLVKENNKILRKMRRAALWSGAFRVFYWLIIIGLSLGAYYYIQPIIQPIVKAFSSSKDTAQNLQTSFKLPTISDFLK